MVICLLVIWSPALIAPAAVCGVPATHLAEEGTGLAVLWLCGIVVFWFFGFLDCGVATSRPWPFLGPRVAFPAACIAQVRPVLSCLGFVVY